MRQWQRVLAGVGLFVVALLLTVPATLLRRALPAGLEVGQFEGTLWQGRAAALRWQGQPLLDALQWDWQLLRLLTLDLVFDLDTRWQGQDGHGRVVAGFSSLQLQDADLTVPLEPLISGVPQLTSYRLRGNLQLVTEAFSWTGQRGRGELEAAWRDARSDYSGDAIMGQYRMVLKAADKGYAVKVSTLDGVLQISGDGSGSPGQGWNVGAVIHAPPAQLPQFQTLLNRIGPPNPDGKYVLRYSFK